MTEWRNIHHLHQLLYLALHPGHTQVLFGVVRGVKESGYMRRGKCSKY